ncbi:hypothetical protein EAG21025_42690 (plasmid) [Enterobacter asburiae]
MCTVTYQYVNRQAQGADKGYPTGSVLCLQTWYWTTPGVGFQESLFSVDTVFCSA